MEILRALADPIRLEIARQLNESDKTYAWARMMPLLRRTALAKNSKGIQVPLGWRLRLDSNWFSSGARVRIKKALSHLRSRRPRLAQSVGGPRSVASKRGFPRAAGDG
jgi:hypothetical protein